MWAILKIVMAAVFPRRVVVARAEVARRALIEHVPSLSLCYDEQMVSVTIAKGPKAMGWLAFWASIIGSLAWPIAIIIIGWLFRTQVAALFGKVRTITWGDAKVDFAEKLDEIEASAAAAGAAANVPAMPPGMIPPALLDTRFQALLAISPNAAILDAWAQVEDATRQLASFHDLSANLTDMPAQQMALGLKSKGVLPTNVLKMLAEMRKLRNAAAHNQNITPTDALRFKELADRVLIVVRAA